VHNHPSGDARPSTDDIRTTRRLAHVSHELDLPLLDHLIIAGDELREVGYW
jgi:DNA repair protein RadC